MFIWKGGKGDLGEGQCVFGFVICLLYDSGMTFEAAILTEPFMTPSRGENVPFDPDGF